MQVKSLSLESSTKHVALRHGLLIYFKGYLYGLDIVNTIVSMPKHHSYNL